MSATLSWDEIKRRYPDEWVVLSDFQVDCCDVTAGVVVDHGTSKEAVNTGLDQVPSSFALLFTGQLRGNLFGVDPADGERLL